MSGFSAFGLNTSKSGNILFRSMPDGNCLFSSASLSLVGEITKLTGACRVMAAAQLQANTTYYVQHPALKLQTVLLWKKANSNRW